MNQGKPVPVSGPAFDTLVWLIVSWGRSKMNNLPKTLFLTLFLIGRAIDSQTTMAAEPQDLVRGFAEAFTKRDKEKVISCLSDGFLKDFKVQYIAKIQTYDDKKRQILLQIFNVDRLENLEAMTGKVILGKFLDSPISQQFWKVFDIVEPAFDVDTIERADDRATVKLRISQKVPLKENPATIFSLVRIEGAWKIERYSKEKIER